MQAGSEERQEFRVQAGRRARRWWAIATVCLVAFAAYLAFAPSPVHWLWGNLLGVAVALSLGACLGYSQAELGPGPRRRGALTTRQFWIAAGINLTVLVGFFACGPIFRMLGQGLARHPADAQFAGQAVFCFMLLIALTLWRLATARRGRPNV
jgi:hypothetical protein